ncbi:hypothetical protein LSG31_16780 [Fodinisporobacter ferrooxydans]|uniref:Uncharacterized protein n=1 Tax=Fodinisporobacter ferrooxydans TaxID=2901836 RepID=A0ABY4CG92_9BACL|nr:hypothetical protein LSG31_16780 [Alicyclobacillaceae bacterium MYW30-H2]
MYGAWYSFISTFAALVLVGMVIKVMDDALDIEYDTFLGKRTLPVRLGRATLPYCLMILAIAIYLQPPTTLSLFMASYIIGMGHDFREKMPSQIRGWAESAIAVVLMLLLVGWNIAFWSIAIMIVIQLLDDLSDIRDDVKTGQRNFAVRFGILEVTFVLLIAFAIAVLLSPLQSVFVLLATPVVHALLSLLERRQNRARSQ